MVSGTQTCVQVRIASSMAALLRSNAARELDDLDGKAEWRAEPPAHGERIAAATAQLRAAREACDAGALMQTLGSMMTRNFEGINAPHLHSECRVGTKLAIEAYMDELCELQRPNEGIHSA